MLIQHLGVLIPQRFKENSEGALINQQVQDVLVKMGSVSRVQREELHQDVDRPIVSNFKSNM